MEQLSFSALAKMSEAIATLQVMAEADPNISMSVDDIKGLGALRKKRSDAKTIRVMQPQTSAVLEGLRRRGAASVKELAGDTGFKESSVRAQLTTLRRIMLAGKERPRGSKNLRWVILPAPDNGSAPC